MFTVSNRTGERLGRGGCSNLTEAQSQLEWDVSSHLSHVHGVSNRMIGGGGWCSHLPEVQSPLGLGFAPHLSEVHSLH